LLDQSRVRPTESQPRVRRLMETAIRRQRRFRRGPVWPAWSINRDRRWFHRTTANRAGV